MTPQRARELLPFITAFANGEIIQRRDDDHQPWEDIYYPSFTGPAENYRIKPKLKTRKMTFEELPLDAWYKDEDDRLRKITGFDPKDENFPISINNNWFNVDSFLEVYTSYTLDDPRSPNAKWLPLEVKE